MDQQKKELSEALSDTEKVLIGIGGEWKLRDNDRDVRQCCLGDQVREELWEAHAALWDLIRDKDYHVAITVTDRTVYDTDFDSGRVVAPCGSIHQRQYSKVCTRDTWEEGRVPNDICLHCKAPLTGNTVDAEIYIREGCLPRQKTYKK